MKILRQTNLMFGVIALLFVVVTLVLLPNYRYSLNPDGVGYFDVAIKYAHGHFSQSINGAWSPLLSWLLIPFVWTHRNLQLAYFLLAMLSSLVSIWVIYKIMRDITTRWFLQATVLVIAAVNFLSWSLAGPITGDIFLVTAGLLLVLSFNNFIKRQTWGSIILLSSNGAIFYFAKSIGFFVFLGTIVVLMALEFKKARSSNLFKCYILVAVVFLLMCLPWIAAISHKYKIFTVSTVGTTNLYLAGTYNPSTTGYSLPLTNSGPYAPLPGDNTPWDDPSVFREQMAKTFHRLPTKTKIHNYYNSILRNADVFLKGVMPVLLVVGVMGMLAFYKKQPYTAMVLGLLSTISLIGCLLSYLELRYLYILTITLLLGVAVIVNQQTRKIAMVGSVLALLLVIAPLQELRARSNFGRAIWFDAQNVSQTIPSAADVLSDDPSVIYYCYYGNFRCHYTVVSTQGLADYIKTHHIRYFLLSDIRDISSQPDFWRIMHENNVKVVQAPALTQLAGK